MFLDLMSKQIKNNNKRYTLNFPENFISTEFLEFSHKYHRDWNVGSGFSAGIFPEEKKSAGFYELSFKVKQD
jgi:ribosomal protein L13E